MQFSIVASATVQKPPKVSGSVVVYSTSYNSFVILAPEADRGDNRRIPDR